MHLSFSISNRLAGFTATLGLAVALIPAPAMAQTLVPAASAATRADMPLLAPWGGPHGGVPAFDKVRVADFKPALEAAMAENLTEINTIASNPVAPNFENTIAAMERSGQTLTRVSAIYDIWSSTLNDPAFAAMHSSVP